MQKRPLILVSNDDGYQAPGVHRLVDFLSPLGAEIVVVCPDGPRSGQSCAITVDKFLHINPVETYHGAKFYKVDGTPVDCVKLAMHTVLDRRPDLVVAGINHGSNASINCIYSGTMGAVFEGCASGIPAIGFSLTDHSMDADFTACQQAVVQLCQAVLAQGLPDGICINVNIPKHSGPNPRMRLVNECRGNWSDEYAKYVDPHGKDCYFLTGCFTNDEPDNHNTDEYVLAHGEISVVPVALWRNAGHDGMDWLRGLCHKS